MKMNLPRSAVAAVLAASLVSTAAYAGGNWSTLPQAEQPSFCGSTVTGTGGLGGITGQGQGTLGSICGQTIPAGPTSITGNELIPADTGLAGGASPQTETIPLGLLQPGNSGANALTGSDFGLALWQRGTNSYNVTPSTAQYWADGWYVYSSGNTVQVQKETGSADVYPGTLASMRVGRPTGSNVTAICTGQILPTKESQRFIGNNSIFSAYLLAGAGFSPTNSAVTMTIAYYTAADSATSGTNTGTFASSIGSTQNIAGYIEVVNGIQNISTTWTRYSVAATIPSVNASGTTVTGVGVKICYTPTGSGGTTDYFEVAQPQFESRGGTSVGPSAFNRRLPTEEWQFEYARVFEISEGSASRMHGAGYASSSTAAEAYVQFPVEQRLLTPTMSFTNGFAFMNGATVAENCSAGLAAGTNTVNSLGVGVQCNVTSGLTLGQGAFLIENGNTGVIQAASEP